MCRSPTIFAFAAVLGIALAGISACASDTALAGRSGGLSVYGAKVIAAASGIERVVGPVAGLACGDRYYPAKGQAEALRQLQAGARARGGDGVTSVQFAQVSNARSPCWHGVEATGLAVVYSR